MSDTLVLSLSSGHVSYHVKTAQKDTENAGTPLLRCYVCQSSTDPSSIPGTLARTSYQCASKGLGAAASPWGASELW